MKKWVRVLALCMALSLLPAGALAADTAADADLEVVGGTLVKYHGPGGDIEIPSSGSGSTITAIGPGAFQDCTSLTGVLLPYEVTVIGDNAFAGCSNLKKVELPGGTEPRVIGNGAFQGCSSLSYIGGGYPYSGAGWPTEWGPDPEGVVALDQARVGTIGSNAFFGCSSLRGISLGYEMSSIAPGAFSGMDSLEVFVGNGGSYSVIDGVLFKGYEWAPETLIRYPPRKVAENGRYCIPNVTEIAAGAFEDAAALREVEFSGSVDYIGDSAFKNSGLTEITLPEGVRVIHSSAFENCAALEVVLLPSSLEYIGEFAFAGSGLTGITIPEGVLNIGRFAFAGCTALTGRVTVPNSVNTVGDYAFAGSGLTSLDVKASQIGSFAFSECEALTEVSLLDGVTEISDYAFQYCTALSTITFSDSVTNIGRDAFRFCQKLTSVNFH